MSLGRQVKAQSRCFSPLDRMQRAAGEPPGAAAALYCEPWSGNRCSPSRQRDRAIPRPSQTPL